MLATHSNFSITSPSAFKQLPPNGAPIQIFGKSNVNSLDALCLSADAEHPSVEYLDFFIYAHVFHKTANCIPLPSANFLGPHSDLHTYELIIN